MLDIAMRIAGFLSGSNDLGSPRYDIAKDYSFQLVAGTGAEVNFPLAQVGVLIRVKLASGSY